MMRRALPVLLAVACVLATPASATTRSKYLWATVNICDTANNPNRIGIRGSIPGDADRTRMYMRFTVQYYSRTDQAWIDVAQNGRSGWIHVGTGIYRSKQAGNTFGPFPTPSGGATFTLRGAVDFRWTKHGHTIRTAHVVTTAGHPNTLGSDPAGYSAAVCEIT